MQPSRLCLLALFAGVLAAPVRPAHAGLSLAVSVGSGGEVSPQRQYIATNLMVAPGLSLANLLKVELGIVGSLNAVQSQNINGLDIELRPMLVISPPILPLYARLILAGVNLFSADRTLAYGGALGIGIAPFGLGIFAELGVIPRVQLGSFIWLLEGRAGLSFSF